MVKKTETQNSVCVELFVFTYFFLIQYREVTRQLVLRAEKAGFKAIVLTVDTPVFGLRRADVRNKFVLPKHLK